MNMNEDNLDQLWEMMFGSFHDKKWTEMSGLTSRKDTFSKTDDPVMYPPLLIKCKNNE